MLEMIREAQALFKEIDQLLDSPSTEQKDYFANLNEATQQAYIAINQGMHEHSDIRLQCVNYRNYLYQIIQILDVKENDLPYETFAHYADEFRTKIKELIERVSVLLSSL